MKGNEPFKHPLTVYLVGGVTPLPQDVCDSNRPCLSMQVGHDIKVNKRGQQAAAEWNRIDRLEAIHVLSILQRRFCKWGRRILRSNWSTQGLRQRRDEGSSVASVPFNWIYVSTETTVNCSVHECIGPRIF
jgi:hypothetical protein